MSNSETSKSSSEFNSINTSPTISPGTSNKNFFETEENEHGQKAALEFQNLDKSQELTEEEKGYVEETSSKKLPFPPSQEDQSSTSSSGNRSRSNSSSKGTKNNNSDDKSNSVTGILSGVLRFRDGNLLDGLSPISSLSSNFNNDKPKKTVIPQPPKDLDSHPLVQKLKNYSSSQRNRILLYYADSSSSSASIQYDIDKILQFVVAKESQEFFEKAVKSLSQAEKGYSKSNNVFLKEFHKFWKVENHQVENVSSTDLKLVKAMIPYVPKLVLRRLFINSNPIVPPEKETFCAAVMFADISGFTPLTEKLGNKGLEGVETLTNVLNTYFDYLINIIHTHGGDIIKFAGDAVLVMWPCYSQKSLSGMINLCCQCALELLDKLNNYEVKEAENSKLLLHIGLGAGNVTGITIGGAGNRVEYFISGQVLEQVSDCEKEASPGEVYISSLALKMTEGERLKVIKSEKSKDSLSPNFKLVEVSIPYPLPVIYEMPLLPSMGDSLNMYLPPAVRRHIESDSKQWLAELRPISVIFLNLTQPFKDSQLNELQGAIYVMQQIIYKYQGTIRQFMIDDKGSVLIVGFGLPPFAHADDAIRAVETAIDLNAKLEELKITCSIGVTTGKAFCGAVGSTARREYAMVGDIVNLSARLMAAAKMGILVDSETYQRSKHVNTLSFKALPPIRVKGKANPIDIYVPSRKLKGETVQQVGKPLIGREKELSTLYQLIEKMKQHSLRQKKNFNSQSSEDGSNLKLGSGEYELQDDIEHYGTYVVIVQGDTGVGKTRFVQEIVATMEATEKFFGNGDEFRGSTQYYAYRDIFERILDQGKIAQKWVNSLGEENLPLLNEILPIQIEDNAKTSSLSAQVRAEKTKELLIKILKELIAPGSLIVIEDAHHLDSASWSLTHMIVHELKQVLIILTMRSFSEDTANSYQYTQMLRSSVVSFIHLQNLSESDSAKLIAQCLKVERVPPRVVKSIHNTSQGNPYFLQEIVNSLREKEAIQISKLGECLTTDVDDALQNVPVTLNGLLNSKVDKLPTNQQIILKTASVIGRVFSFDLLIKLCPDIQDPESLKKDLTSLESMGFISVEPDPNLTYSFNNVLRDVIYEQMLFAQKRLFHGKILEIYQKRYTGQPAYYHVIAYHSKQAGEIGDAIEKFIKAGSYFLNLYANKEAAKAFSEALKLLTSSEADKSQIAKDSLEFIELERKLGLAYINLGDIKSADSHLRHALEKLGISVPMSGSKRTKVKHGSWRFTTASHAVLEELPHRKREAMIMLLALTTLNYFSCSIDICSFCADAALSLGADVGKDELGRAYALVAVANSIQNNYHNAENYLKKSFEISESTKTVDLKKFVSLQAGIVSCGKGDWKMAEQHFENCIQASNTSGDLRAWEEAHCLLSSVYFMKGDFQKSGLMAKEALKSARKRGDMQTEVLGMCVQLRNLYECNRKSKSQELLNSLKVALETFYSDPASQLTFHSIFALIKLRRDEFVECFNSIETCLELIKTKEPLIWLSYTGYSAIAECLVTLYSKMNPSNSSLKIPIKAPTLSSAIKTFFSAFKKYSKIFPFSQSRFKLWRGIHFHLQGKSSKCEKNLSSALEICSNMGMKFEESLILYFKGRYLNLPGEYSRAIKSYKQLEKREKFWKSDSQSVQQVGLHVSKDSNE